MIRARLGPASALLTLVLTGTLGLVPHALRSANAQTPSWTLWTFPTGTGPSVRQGATAIYDPVRRRMLVFGGNARTDGGVKNDLWAVNLDGTPAWTQVPTAGTTPPARADHTAIYDPVGDQMVVFGGETESNTENDACPTANLFDDTWFLSLSGTPTWTRLDPSITPPCARSGHSAVYDSNLGRMLVFGGVNIEFQSPCDAFIERQDTWGLYLTANPYWLHNYIYYDPLTACGQSNDAEFACPSNDNQSRPNYPSCNFPAERQYQGAVYDPVRNRMLVLGGWYGPNTNYQDFYQMVPFSTIGNHHWQYLPVISQPNGPQDHPSGKGAVTMVYTSDKDRIYTFGGANLTELDDQSSSDTWHIQLNGNEQPTDWVQDSPTGTLPPARHFHSMIYDPVTERVIVFGGVNHEAVPGEEVQYNDVWALNLDTTPPATTTDLGIDSEDCPTASAVIGWTAAGDDGTTGTATSFDLRWSNSTITTANFGSAHSLTAPAPGPAGTHEAVTVAIGFGHTKYFALKTVDNAGNMSGLSNCIRVDGPPSPDGCTGGSAVQAPKELSMRIGSNNPGQGSAVINYAIPRSFAGQSLDLSVFDVAGRRLTQVANGSAVVGRFGVTVDRSSLGGSRQGAGVYYVRLQVGSKSLSQTLVLLP